MKILLQAVQHQKPLEAHRSRPPEDSVCPPGPPNHPKPPVNKNYYQEPRRIKGKQVIVRTSANKDNITYRHEEGRSRYLGDLSGTREMDERHPSTVISGGQIKNSL